MGPQPCFEAKIEIRCVDTDKYVGGRCRPAVNECAAQFEQAGQNPERFHETHDSKHLGVFPALATGRGHLRSRDAFKRRVRDALTQCSDQTGAKKVAGRLASDQSDSHVTSGPRRDRRTAAIPGTGPARAVLSRGPLSPR